MIDDFYNKYCTKRKIYHILFLTLFLLTLSGCNSEKKPIQIPNESKLGEVTPLPNTDKVPNDHNINTGDAIGEEETEEDIPAGAFQFITPEGSTLESRINPPEGYTRIPSDEKELTGYLRSLDLKDSNSEIAYYDGDVKQDQSNHVAIFDMDIGDRDLQQCADSIIRVYAEYYWSIQAYDKIAFHLTNGFLMEYTKWRDGNRIVVSGNKVSWHKSASYDDSYECFRKYLDTVFAYAGTLSLSQECKAIPVDDIRPGDLFLKGGSPGHCILVVDIAEATDGNRCYLLAQGYMPAQDFHVLKNPLHDEDPWYYAKELTFPLETPSWTFDEGSLMRWSVFPLKKDTDIISGYNINNGVESATSSYSVPAMSEEVITEQKDTIHQVKLLAVGDNLIHSEVIKSGKQADGTYNFDHLYRNLKEDISSADIAVINQETILGGEDFAYSGYPNFNSPYEIGEAVVNAGFDVVLHATNHTMDMGEKGIKNTFSFWAKYPEITVLGINKSKENQNTIPILEKNGIKIAMLNYTYGLNGYQLPKKKPYLVNLINKEQITKDIKRARKEADFVIIFPHWGSEYVYKATDTQKKLTKLFYELGADLVIGTHPHVLEPVEWIKSNPDHKMLVYYSLGNFISYQKEAPRMLGGIANVTITKDASGTYISNAGITPVVTHFERGYSDFHYGIFKLSDYTTEQAMAHGVTYLAKNGAFSYEGTHNLAKEILGDWFKE